MEKIPLSVPNLSGNEKKYVNEAIESKWVSTAGTFVNKFEHDIASYLKTCDAVACQSGTAGLHMALLSLGVNSNHEVIAPTLTFIAAVNPIRYVGAIPVFMDCDDSLCMDPEKLEKFCLEECIQTHDSGQTKLINKATGKQIKAMIVVHIFGNMCDMERIIKTAMQYNLAVIEDATEALGTQYTTGQYTSSFAGTIGHLGVFSFNGNKIITTGGGGVVVSNDERHLEKIRYLSTQAKDDEIYYTHNEIGYNYRMTNIQAALGVAQLEQLEFFIRTKTDNYRQYKKSLENMNGLELIEFRNGIRSNYWFYSILIDEIKCGMRKDDVMETLSKQGIQTRPIWGLIHEQKPYRDCQAYKIEKAKWYHERILNLPCSTNLTSNDVQIVMDALKLLKNQ